MQKPGASISVIMPVYNGAAYIAEAIASIAGQSHPPLEIVVIDDGSTDGSGQIALDQAPHLVTLITQAKRGVNVARNAGVRAAQGAFLHFFDADDILPDDALAKLAAALEADEAADAAFGTWQNFWVEELALERDAHAGTSLAKRQNGLMPGTGLYRSEFVRAAPILNETEQLYGFSRWLIERRDQGANFLRLDAPCLERRIHLSNYSRSKTNDDLANFAFNMVARAKRAAKDGKNSQQ